MMSNLCKFVKQSFCVPKQYHLPNFIKNDSVSKILNDLEGMVVTKNVYGVVIYWSPYGSGKTTNLKYFVSKLNSSFENTNEKAYYFNANDDNFEKKFRPIHNAKSGKNIIVIDDYDEYHNDANSMHNYFRACSLAEGSSNEKINRYIIAINNPLIAKSISNFNGGEKFYTLGSGIGFDSTYLWNDDAIKMYIESKIEILKKSEWFKTNSIRFDDLIKNRFFELGIKSKNPRFIDYVIDTYVHKNEFYSGKEEYMDIFKQEYDIFASMHYDQWIHGIKYLNNKS